MKVFLSVGATYTPQQESFVSAFESFLVQNGCVRHTVGRGTYTARQPILKARELMQDADAVVVLAFTRTIVRDAIEKPTAKDEVVISNTRYPTVWNQLEAAMAFGLDLPLLVIVEQGLHQEAMLKDRMEFRALITELSPDFFKTEEFKGVFADFRRIAGERTTKAAVTPAVPQESVVDVLARATVIDILRGLKFEHVWKVGSLAVAIAVTSFGAAYWVAKHFP